MSGDDILIWQKGEKYFSKMLGIKYASKFERDGENVTVSYEKEQGEKVHLAIKKFLKKDGNFDELCDFFINRIIDKHLIQAEMMPFLIIADEIDNYPEIASDYIKRRLMRIRTSTHEESYK